MTTTHAPSNEAAAKPSEATQAPIKEEIQFKKVAIAIAGKTYYVNCPANEEASLQASVSYINNFALSLKSDMPRIGQEDLLVLCCLNLYEKLQEQKTSNTNERLVSQEADTLLEKIIKDAKTMIG
jgi:cell division protein ZapA